jgi:hypothetical protein
MQMPPNTSATGGLLLPGPGVYSYDFSLISDPAYWSESNPTDGQPLEDLLQQIVRGMTGLPGDLVRPLWQPEPPPIPSYETDWIALGVVSADLDPGFPFEWIEPPPSPVPVGADGELLGTFMIQHEIFELKCVFYGPHSDWFDALVRDAFSVGQNRELLFLAGMGLVSVGTGVLVPEYIQSRWWRRIDRSIRIHREIRRLYPILELVAAQGVILSETSPPVTFQAEAPVPSLLPSAATER